MNQNSMSSVEEVGNWSVHIGLNLVTHIILKMKQMNKRYCLVHTITGYSYGSWKSYTAAECSRNKMDDWIYWSIMECE